MKPQIFQEGTGAGKLGEAGINCFGQVGVYIKTAEKDKARLVLIRWQVYDSVSSAIKIQIRRKQ